MACELNIFFLIFRYLEIMNCLTCNIEVNIGSVIKIGLPGLNYKVVCFQCWPWIETLIYRLGNY